jgi:phospholipid/cholesterol/gamma-HCH transport system permease protein
LLLRTGVGTQSFLQGVEDGLEFLGQLSIAMVQLVRGRAHYRKRDLWVFVQDAGPRALGIVSLISFLVGLILAFVGAAQLRQFGAGIYVADLVGIAVVREMGAMMTAVIMAGRTGAAFAAQLGTMTANEEIDALRTAGISPIEFLVLPRVLSLCLMMPLLALFSDVVGIVGGACVATSMLEVSPSLYFAQTMDAITLDHFLVGLAKSVFFGAIVAFFGCLRGLQSGRDAAAVGNSATRAVVASIVALVVADGIFAVFFDVLGI